MRKMAKNSWQEMKMNHAIRGFATAVTGIIMTAFLWWLFSGFGFWELPGLLILFIGVAEIFYVIYRTGTAKKSTWIHMGLLVLFIGVSGYISLAGHVMLGTLQMISLVVMVIGILLLAIGLISHPKT
jgi:hypothetical protein